MGIGDARAVPEPGDRRTVRIGLLGASRIAPIAIIRAAADREDTQVVCVAARDPIRARAFADQHDIPDACGYSEMLARGDIDLVYLALPPRLHAAWTIAALESGIAVLCEKPFARDVAEARAMVGAGLRAGRPLMEAFHYRFHPGFRRAESIVESGELGELTHCSVTVQHPMPFRPDEFRFSLEDGGALMDLGCYAVHALRTLVREEPRVSYAASKRVHGVDITTEAKLIFPSGCSGAFRCSLGPEERSHRILLEGTKGHMTIVNFVSPQHGGTLHVVTNGQARHESISGETSYESQLEHVIAVVTSGARGLTGGADAIANMELLGAVRAAANR